MNANPMFPIAPPVFLEMTNLCNLKCPYCGNRNLTRPKGRISMAFVRRMVELCVTEDHELKWLHGAGEPLLHPDLCEIVRYINKESGLNASFATNATLLRPETFEKLLESGLRSLYVSLDSIDPKTYGETRGADLDMVIGNVRAAIAMMPEDFVIHIALMHFEGQAVDEEYLRRFRDIFGDSPNVRPNVINNAIQPASKTDMRMVKYTLEHCVKPQQYFSVTFDGKVCLCCMDQDAEHQLGNLNTQTINEVWFDPANQQTFRRLLLGEPGCPNLCVKSCHMRPSPVQDAEVAPGSREELLHRAEHAEAFFTKFNPKGLEHLERVVREIKVQP